MRPERLIRTAAAIRREYHLDPERAARALVLLLTKKGATVCPVAALHDGDPRDAADPQPADDGARPPLPVA